MPKTKLAPKIVDVTFSLQAAEQMLSSTRPSARSTKNKRVLVGIEVALVKVRQARRAYAAEQKRLNANRKKIEATLTRIEHKMADAETNMRFLARVRRGVKK